MTDEVQVPSDEDTTANAPSSEDTATQADIDWQERYANLQPEYTRATQRLSQIEENLRDPDKLREFLAGEFGYEFEEEDTPEEDEYGDPYESLRSEVEALKAERQQEREERERERAAQEQERYVANELNALEKEIGFELTDEDRQDIGDFSLLVRNQQGKPDVKAAYKRLSDGFAQRHHKRYIPSKKASRPGSGAAAKEKVNLDNPDERREYIASRLDELEA